MSLDELLAREASLDAEILAQEDALRQLRRDRCLVWRQINALRDPIVRLPPELTTEVFMRTLDPTISAAPSHAGMPSLLLNICSAWTSIVISTPALWATIRIDFSRLTDGLRAALPLWLDRAKNHALSLYLKGLAFDEDIMSLIWSHAAHIGSLDIRLPVKRMPHHIEEAELWGSCRPEHLPILETLRIQHSDVNASTRLRSIPQLLSVAPNLLEFFFDRLDTHPEALTDELILPRLRQFSFGRVHSRCFWSGANEFLSLPNLEVLTVSAQAMSMNDLLAFLKRSSPPLRTLIFESLTFYPDDLFPSFQPLEYLTRLEFVFANARMVEKILVPLAEDLSLLPHLDTLILESPHSVFESFWIASSGLLLARRRRFRAFRIERILPASKGPLLLSPETLVSFAELVDEGMDLHIDGHFK
ncbi:hypothetical protein R3P38DRAFT_3132563 [Favolaschia claudopus]|uniref:F-box domain-containing protein n=1 Tax=Favolaschia claudopus TaxID=2862362 RepID=A0AAV9Z8S8_9AGAR